MALTRAKRSNVIDFLGLQDFATDRNLAPGWWTSSSNIVVTNDGSAAVLRSPANFNPALATGNKVLSGFHFPTTFGGDLLLQDINLGSIGVSSVRTYIVNEVTNVSIRSNQADARWKRLPINGSAYGVNGHEMMQYNSSGVAYMVGIPAPASAPTLSFVAGGSGSLVTGVTVSYAYRNSDTGHVGQASDASATSGASTNPTLRTAVVASTLLGVDGIVLFITADGGAIRYLYVDANGDPVIFSNTTGNIDISLDLIDNLDTLTPETAYNGTPPQNAFFMFQWGDRLCLCDFRGATTRQQIQYNVNENCYYGVPWESWWPLNIINIPNKADAARSGIETPVGALVLGERDAYLIRGVLTDKISSPENLIAVTEHMQAMNWSIGTKSPYSLVATPFGEMWLDQNKRIQLWQREGFPVEAGLPMRTSLAAIQDTPAARAMAEAAWFQFGDAGGHYVLTASTTGSTNNMLFIVTVYRDPESGQVRWASSTSDIAAQSIFTGLTNTATPILLIGVTDRLQEILDLDAEGAGWSSSQDRFFSITIGAQDEFCYFHSLRFDASDVTGLTITVANIDGTESSDIEYEQDGQSYYGLIDDYGYLKRLTFSWSSDDTEKRVVQNLRIASSLKTRLV